MKGKINQESLMSATSMLILINIVFVASPPAGYSQSLVWSHFTPLVISETYVGTVDLLCMPTGNFTEIRFKPAWTDVELPLSDRGGGVYGITLNAGDIIAGLTDADVNRKFAGYLRVYNGPPPAQSQYNEFLDVLTASIPSMKSVQLAADVQVTSHLFNMAMISYDIWASVQDIAKEFYKYHDDSYDFMNIVFDEGLHENRTSMGVSNSIYNIGKAIFDNTAQYGSAGRLKTIMRFPIPSFFDGASEGFCHEIGHTWINSLNFYPLQNIGGHWPISTLAEDIMGFSMLNGVGGAFPYTFSQTGPNSWQLVQVAPHPKDFSDLSLYLMGLLPAAEVITHMVFENQDQPIIPGANWEGPVIYLNGSDVVARMGGERIPNYQDSQKIFKVATILVTKGNLASPEMTQLYDWFASRASLVTQVDVHEGLDYYASNPFYVATGGRATMDSMLEHPFAPEITSLSPAGASACDPGFVLSVIGSDFVDGDVVRWGWSDRQTTFVNSSKLEATIGASDLTTARTVTITVRNPNGGISNALDFSVSGFTLGASPTSATVTAGQSATYDIQVTPQYGPFNSSVSFSCAGLPSKCVATFSPANVTPGANPSTVTLTLATQATTGSSAVMITGSTGLVTPALTLSLSIIVLFFAYGFRKPILMRPLRLWSAAGAVLCLIALLATCSSGGDNNPPAPAGTLRGTHQITVQGNTSCLMASTSVTLVVR